MVDWAYAANGFGGQDWGNMFPLIMMLSIFTIFYFLLIRHQQKKAKEHREMINNLKKGDRIITGGGIHGRITGMDDTLLTVEIADKVRVKVSRGNVSALVQSTSGAPAKTDSKSK